jgi:uncharacterized phage protein (TIGR02220 family)
LATHKQIREQIREGEVGTTHTVIHDGTITKIIDRLNEVTGKQFNPKTEATRKLIRGRIREGHTPEDFDLCIRHRNHLWGSDPKMSQYLRPATLFSPSKFDGYVQAARKAMAERKARPVTHATGGSLI